MAVETGGRRYVPQFRILDLDESAAALADYERRNALVRPIVRGVLSGLAGWRYDSTDPSRRRLVAELPVVGLRPK